MLRVNTVFFFDLKMVCGGYAYYVTHTQFKTWDSRHRNCEVRYASPVEAKIFMEVAEKVFGQSVRIIRAEADYNKWLYAKGWAIVPKTLARSLMPQWLKSAACLKTATRIYTDIEIVSPSALKQHITRKRKEHVLTRDGKRCLACGKGENEEKLTMQHGLPFSSGGETTARNLVVLCLSCNQTLGRKEVTELYEKAGLHFAYDPSLFALPRTTTKPSMRAMELSDNLMQTRCDIW